MKGIVLAGGTGSRLAPITSATSKQLLPIYNKPLIFYPIATLMLAGIRDILIISTQKTQDAFMDLLGDGSQLNINFKYEIQESPKGLAEAFIIGEKFIGSDPSALILGDNIFHGNNMGRNLAHPVNFSGAHIFGCPVSNPSDYGIVYVDSHGKPIEIREKPINPESNLAVPGLYFFDNSVISRAKEVRPSARGELEITSVIQSYLDQGSLELQVLNRGITWFDAGTFTSLLEASEYVRTVENRQGLMIANLEEIAWRNGWIGNESFLETDLSAVGSHYRVYKEMLIREIGSSKSL